MQNDSEKIIEKIIFIILKGLILMAPLFFLPWTASILGIDNFNKWNLLIVFAPLAALFFLIDFIYKEEFKLKISKIDSPILIFLIVYFLAALFGIDRFSSFFGADNLNQPFFGLLALALFYFLVKNFINFEKIYGLLKIALFSFFIVIIFASLLLASLRFGLISEENSIVNYFNSAIGTLEDLSLYIAVLLVLIMSIISAKNELFFFKNWQMIFLKIIIVLSLVFLGMINFSPAWICLLAGSLALYFANLYILKRYSLLPVIIIFLSIAFLFLNFLSAKDSTENRMASKLHLDFKNTVSVSLGSLKDNPLLGSGQENFSYVFSKYRNENLNSSPYWYLRYNNPYSYVLGIISQAGIIGFLSYLLIIYFIIIYIIRLFYQNKKDIQNTNSFLSAIIFSLSAVIFALLVSQFFYPFNANLWFLFWLFLAFLVICMKKVFPENEREIVFAKKDKPAKFRFLIIIIFLFFSGWFILTALNIKYWIAEAFSRQESNEQALISAARLNPYRYSYQINLARYYLEKFAVEINKPQVKIDINLVQDNIKKGIDYSKNAVSVAPYSVSAYENLGMIYNQIDKYGQDASGAAILAFNQAVRLEPTNPVLVSELGKAYLANGQIEPAILNLEKSVKLKNDYYEGNLFLARAYEQANKYQEALEILKSLLETNNDPEINYEIGLVYFNEKKYDLAILEFQKVTTQVPNHANALYSLALSYESIRDKKSALYYFKKVLALNPGNAEINKKIGELENK